MFVPCVACQLRQKSLFHQVSEKELDFVTSLKSAHIAVPQKTDIVNAGEVGGSLYTLFGGWAFRYKKLPDGKRQILNFLLPGDLIGLESAVFGGVEHSVPGSPRSSRRSALWSGRSTRSSFSTSTRTPRWRRRRCCPGCSRAAMR